jgi:hypothetical protein
VRLYFHTVVPSRCILRFTLSDRFIWFEYASESLCLDKLIEYLFTHLSTVVIFYIHILVTKSRKGQILFKTQTETQVASRLHCLRLSGDSYE